MTLIKHYHRPVCVGVLLVSVSPVVLAQNYNGLPTCRSDITANGLIWPHSEGLSYLSETSRTPSGLLYGHPQELPLSEDESEKTGWQYVGGVEIGLLSTSGTTDTATFNEYNDWGKTFTTGQLQISGNKVGSADYFKASASNIGRDDGCYQFVYGRAGIFKLGAYYNGVPHVFTNHALVLWNGVGAGSLTLPSSLTAGASTVAEVLSAFDGIADSRLALRREKGGVVADYKISKQLKFKSSLSSEWRKGTRPIGGTFNYPGSGQLTELAEPINHRTIEVKTGLDYTGKALSARLNYIGSFFKNEIESLTWENPGLSSFGTPLEEGQMALAPSNSYHALSADISAPLQALKGHFTAVANWSVSSQNSPLLPHTTAAALSPWDTVESLSQSTADAKFTRLTLTSNLTVNPSRSLRLTAKLRYEDQDNDTEFLLLNPLTDQYGYLTLNGAFGGVFDGLYYPANSNFRRIRSVPFEKDMWQASLQVDIRLTKKSKLSAKFQHKEEQRFPREVDETKSDLFRLSYSNRALTSGTVRLSYEYENRKGSDYVSFPYNEYYSSSLPGYNRDQAFTLSDLKKYDIAPNSAHKIDGKVNFILNEVMDLAFSGQYESKDYGAEYGLREASGWRLSSEWTYQIDTASNLYIYASFDGHDRLMANIKSASASNDGSAGGVTYPLTNAWSEQAHETTTALGAGYSRRFEGWTFDANYSYSKSRSRLNYDYTTGAAYGNNFTESEVGDGLPDQLFEHQLLTSSARVMLSDHLQLRILYRFEKEDIEDFHYDNLTSPVVGNDIYLLAFPRDYSAHVIGAFVGFRF